MKNTLRILSMIAMTSAALAATASPTFAAHRARPSARKPVAMKHHKKASKKVVINLERPGSRKVVKAAKKTGAFEPAISRS